MTDASDIARLKRFAQDRGLFSLVGDEILSRFLKSSQSKDVHYLAAKSIAIDLFSEVWADLSRLADTVEKEKPEATNVGM